MVARRHGRTRRSWWSRRPGASGGQTLRRRAPPGHRGKPFLERGAGGGVASARDGGAHSEGQLAVGAQGPRALS